MNKENLHSRRDFLGKLAFGMAGASISKALLANTTPTLHLPGRREKEEKSFIPVMITAYHQNGKIDYKGMAKLMDLYLDSGAKGFFANCLSSEMYQLSNEERLNLTRYVVDHVDGRVPVVASGSFGESIAEKADFTKKISDTGIDAVILITSHFAGKEEEDDLMIKNLEKFLDLTPGISIGTYECPSPYKRILTPEVLKFLLASERLVYHKDTTEDIENIKNKLSLAEGTTLGLYNAHIGSAASSLQHGGKGLSLIAGNFYPEIITWMCQNAANPERKEDVDWLQTELTRAEPLISSHYQLGSRYFLNKKGLSLEIKSRSSQGNLPREQIKVLDQLFEELQAWHDRLGIEKV